jgi:phage terminase large subunit
MFQVEWLSTGTKKYMKLSKKQSQALRLLQDQLTTELVFGGGAGGGKSILGCYWVLKSALKYPGTRWVIGRASLKTLKETTLNSFFLVCQIQGIKPGLHFKYNEVRSIISIGNGSEILLKDLGFYPSDPNFDELGSLEITGAFVDECNQIIEKAWLVLKSRIRYRLDEYGIIPKMLGTCNPAKNWVYMQFYGPSSRKELPKHKAFVQSLINDNPEISKHYRENLLSLDKASKERLLYGNWEYDDDPTAICSYDAILDCFTNNVSSGEKAISADLAMQGRDRFVVGSWEGMVCYVAIDKEKATGKEIQEDLETLMKSSGTGRSQTIADSDGLGAYLVSYLEGIKEFHGGASAYDKKEFANLKSECGYKLAEMVNNRKLRIICTVEQKQRIIEELGVLKADSVDKDETKKRIIKKEMMKELLQRSPDYLDMLLMRMWFLVRTKPLEIIG